MFVLGKPFQPSLMFASNAGAYPSEKAPLRLGLGLSHKQQTRLERLAKRKHSGSLKKLVNYNPKIFYNIWPKVAGLKAH